MRDVARPARVLGLLLALAGGVAAAGPTRPQVRCHVDYGGEVRRIDVVAVTDVAAGRDVAPVEIGSYFRFRALPGPDGRGGWRVRIATYADRDDGPVPIHEATHALPPRRAALGPHGFTGLQKVYEPVRDGELQYWCERIADAPAPPAPPVVMAPPEQQPPANASRRGAKGTVRLVFAGDVMLDDGPGRTIAAGGDPLAPFDAFLRDADYTIGNLECPIATTGSPMDSKIYTFRANPRVLPVLRGRFDALAVSNNHAGDYGRAAFVETIEHLHASGIAAFGGGRDLRTAHAPLWIERGGLRIAVLGYTEFKPRAFEAGATWPGVAWSDDVEVIADIRAARQAGADVVIPFLHWGWEREPEPGERQRTLARRLIEAGADAVVGGHPHVTQGADVWRGKPIIWSLGNFVFDGFDLPPARVGWMLRLTLDRHGVRAWDTVEARIDAQGTPHPAPQAWTPCGRRGEPTVGHCQAVLPAGKH
jgi:poly-gamma-glutamate synthesis protein (capsule biosynthesis protein)